MDAAADRVFDRHDAVSGRVGNDGLEDLFEGAARDQLRVRIDPSCGSLAEGARLALVCDFHRSSSITHGGPPRSQIDNLYRIITITKDTKNIPHDHETHEQDDFYC